jgi:hypothetical protein
MKYTDSITKNFLSYGQPRIAPNGGVILEWQDPTYLGFQWRILNTTDYTRASGELDLDYYPQGLFLADEDPDSAYSYFIRTNQGSRAAMIKEFRTGFIQLLKEAPWYFTKVSGLADIWKITPGNSYRGKDKKLTIETEEAIDLKITYLMDLYRKAVFDPNWMRYALPENQRMFAMELVVAEVRPMQTTLQTWSDLNAGSSNPGIILNDVGGLFQAAGNFADRIGAIGGIGGAIANAGVSAVAGQIGLRAPWSTTTFLSFRFEQCTFDVFQSAPNYLESVGKIADTKAVNNIVINTPIISEVNSYGLLGAVLKDSYYNGDYNYNIFNVNEQARTINDTLGGKSFSSTVEVELRKLIGRAAVAAGVENVFGLTQGFLNNPLGTAFNAIQSFTRPADSVPAELGNIGLTGEEVELIASILGSALPPNTGSGLVVGDIGNTIEDSQIANPNLVRSSIGTSVEDDVLRNPNLVSSNLPKNILSGPDIVKARLGNVYRP